MYDVNVGGVGNDDWIGVCPNEFVFPKRTDVFYCLCALVRFKSAAQWLSVTRQVPRNYFTGDTLFPDGIRGLHSGM